MKKKYFLIFLFVFTVFYLQAQDNFRQEGIASWYGREFEGRPTASGEIFNASQFTAAHPSLPFGTVVVVTNQHNNKSVIVRINDRGPFVSARIIDISRAAAEQLDMIVTGTAPVTVISIDRIVVSNSDVNIRPETAAAVPAVGTQAAAQHAASQETSIIAQQLTELAEAEIIFASQPVVQASSAGQFKLTPEINIEPAGRYRLQIGSYRNARNAVDAFVKLKNAGLNPSYERFINSNNDEYYRVVLSGINGLNMRLTIEQLRFAGFSEALIRAEN